MVEIVPDASLPRKLNFAVILMNDNRPHSVPFDTLAIEREHLVVGPLFARLALARAGAFLIGHAGRRRNSGSSSSCSKPEPRSTLVQAKRFGSTAKKRAEVAGSSLKCCTTMPPRRNGRLITSPA